MNNEVFDATPTLGKVIGDLQNLMSTMKDNDPVKWKLSHIVGNAIVRLPKDWQHAIESCGRTQSEKLHEA